jgi:hypothetical protein
MIDKPQTEDQRSPRFLIMENTPLSLLGSIEALDWFFEPGCEVMITDMVIAEAVRDPGEGQDQRRDDRAYVAQWLKRNRYRIKVLATTEGRRYEREMLGAGRQASRLASRLDGSGRTQRVFGCPGLQIGPRAA